MEVFFFNDTATTEIYTLSLHDALPIFFPWIAEEASLEEMRWFLEQEAAGEAGFDDLVAMTQVKFPKQARSEEHTSELQSRQYLVCRLLLEKKKTYSSPSTRTITRTPQT